VAGDEAAAVRAIFGRSGEVARDEAAGAVAAGDEAGASVRATFGRSGEVDGGGEAAGGEAAGVGVRAIFGRSGDDAVGDGAAGDDAVGDDAAGGDAVGDEAAGGEAAGVGGAGGEAAGDGGAGCEAAGASLRATAGRAGGVAGPGAWDRATAGGLGAAASGAAVDAGGRPGVRATRRLVGAGSGGAGVEAGASAGERETRAGPAAAAGSSSPSRILAARPTSRPPRFVRATRFSSGVGRSTPAPPMNGLPVAIASSESPNSHSAPQSEIPGTIVLSVADATHWSAAGAGAGVAARATPAFFGTSRIAARTGSGRSCRAATARPSRSPLARVSLASRPRSLRPMRGPWCIDRFSSIADHCCGCISSLT